MKVTEHKIKTMIEESKSVLSHYGKNIPLKTKQQKLRIANITSDSKIIIDEIPKNINL